MIAPKLTRYVLPKVIEDAGIKIDEEALFDMMD